MRQLSLADAEYAGKRKKTRREVPSGKWTGGAMEDAAQDHRAVLPGCWVRSETEHRKASVRAKVEHPFRVIKRQFGLVKVRFRGPTKNTSHG